MSGDGRGTTRTTCLLTKSERNELLASLVVMRVMSFAKTD